MKFLAPLLALFAVWLSAGPQGRYNCSKVSTYEKTSCHKAGKCSKKKIPQLYQAAHSPKETNNCSAGGGCNPFQVCVYCCFLPVDKVQLPEPVILALFLTLRATFFNHPKDRFSFYTQEIIKSLSSIFIMKNLISAAMTALLVVVSMTVFTAFTSDDKAASAKSSCSTSCCSKAAMANNTASVENVAKTDGEDYPLGRCPAGSACCATACNASTEKVAGKTKTTVSKVASTQSKTTNQNKVVSSGE